jgi:D-arginine dehydrogenase
MTYDFIIIGGGIAGVSAAAKIAKLGSTLVLEAEPAIGYHASGRSAAMFIKNYGNDIIRDLNFASHSAHQDGGYLSKRGLMSLAFNDQAEISQQDLAALGMEAISVQEATDIVPIINTDRVGFAGYLENAPDLDTDRMLQDNAKKARSHGATITTGAHVASITRSGSEWVVSGPELDVRGKILVNAAGAWVDEVAKTAGVAPIGFQPFRRSMARVPAPGGHDVTGWPMMHGAGDTWYAKPDAGAWIISPCDEDPAVPHDAFADDMVLAEGIDRYSQMVTTEVTRLQTSWAGLRTFAPDRALVVGMDTDHSDFFWLGGQGGYGFQTAPAASQLAGDLLGGTQSELKNSTVAALSPARFQ